MGERQVVSQWLGVVREAAEGQLSSERSLWNNEEKSQDRTRTALHLKVREREIRGTSGVF